MSRCFNGLPSDMCGCSMQSSDTVMNVQIVWQCQYCSSDQCKVYMWGNLQSFSSPFWSIATNQNPVWKPGHLPLSTVVPIAGNLVEYLDTSVLIQMQFVLHGWREDCSRIGGSKNLGGCNSGCFTTRKRRTIQQIRENTCTLRQTWSQSVLSCFLAFCCVRRARIRFYNA